MFGDGGERVYLLLHDGPGWSMVKRAAQLFRRLLSGQEAQVTVEYALVIAVVAALLLGISAMVVSGLSAHYRDVTSVVCLPIP